MKRNSPIYYALLLFFFSFVAPPGQPALPTAKPEEVGLSSARLAKMDQQMHAYVDDGQLAGVMTAIMRKGKLAHFDMYGYADVSEKKKLAKNSLWRIYSMTKPIVSVGLMMLYEEGHFQLDDPVYKYIPQFKDLTVHAGGQRTESLQQAMRIVDLLTHTSGLGYGWGDGNMVDSLYNSSNRGQISNNAEFVDKLSKIPLYHQPGTKWRYGVSTDVLGRLVEVISGKDLDQYLSERIFGPLNMPDTHFEVPKGKKDRFVTHYRPNKEGGISPVDHRDNSRYTREVTMFSGGGGLVSTAMDYLRFSQMLLNGGELDGVRILSPKTIELMTQDHCKGLPHGGGPIVLPARGTGFGLGFAVTTDLASTNILGSEGAYGWGGAAGTFFRIDPKEEMITLLMIQIRPYTHLQAREKFQTMAYQAVVE